MIIQNTQRWLMGLVLITNIANAAEITDQPLSITLPNDATEYKEGPHVDIARNYCTTCHAADYIYMQPPMPKEKWLGVVQKMQHVFGCPIPENEMDKIADYLTSQNGIKQ